MRHFRIAALAVLAFLAFVPPALSYDQGGVIPGSADDMSFRHGRWVPNRHSAHVGGNFSEMHGRRAHSRNVEVYRWRRLVAVRRYAAPMAQEQPRARCGARCAVARPTCGTRCKPKCSTCGTVAAPRQTNTAKVSNLKSVVKGDGNTVTQTVTVNQTNLYGGPAAIRARSSSVGILAATGRKCDPTNPAPYACPVTPASPHGLCVCR